ncbi:MAG: hypothetical protein K2O01_03935 [Bacteroidales bacterium]|nr:hypothetical protein [Bacteroidales bacterium]
MNICNAIGKLCNLNRTIVFFIRFGLIAGLGLTVSACRSPEERCLDSLRNAVYRGDFENGLAAADRFYEKHAVEKAHPSEEAMALRWEISAYTRLCLLMTDNLNRRFLAYYPVREMGVMFPAPLPLVDRHCYAYARLYHEMGLYGPALPIVLWHAEDRGWTRETVNLLFDIYMRTRQYRIAQTYLQAFRQNGKTRRWCDPWYKIVTDSCMKAATRPDTPDGTRPQPLTDPELAGPLPDETFMDGYVKAVFRHAMENPDPHGAFCPNPRLTDYYTLLCLLEKDLAQVPVLLATYRRQGRPIPDYLQEAALIYASDASHAEALEAAGLTREALRLSPAMEQRVAKVLQDFEMLKLGALPFETMTRRHAATYTYHFLLGQIQ